MNNFVKVIISRKIEDNPSFDTDVVINLGNITMCEPEDKGYTKVYLTSGEHLVIRIQYENFINFIEQSSGARLIKFED